MNTASQNLAQHLDVLRQKLEHPTAYELALDYFLEEFAGDAGFIQQSVEDEAPHLRVVLGQIAARARGQPVALEHYGALYLPQFGFFHGRALAAGQVVLFFYFARANVGLVAMLLDAGRQNQVARFRLPPPLPANPKDN